MGTGFRHSRVTERVTPLYVASTPLQTAQGPHQTTKAA